MRLFYLFGIVLLFSSLAVGDGYSVTIYGYGWIPRRTHTFAEFRGPNGSFVTSFYTPPRFRGRYLQHVPGVNYTLGQSMAMAGRRRVRSWSGPISQATYNGALNRWQAVQSGGVAYRMVGGRFRHGGGAMNCIQSVTGRRAGVTFGVLGARRGFRQLTGMPPRFGR